jgi:hypothetical protein
MMTRFLIFFFSASLMLLGCKYSKRSSVYYDYESECLGVGNQGTTVMRVYSYAKKTRRAAELAKKHAVHAVIFKGVPNGKKGCMDKGLAYNEPDAAQKHSGYFERFFSDNGEYLNFVSISSDESTVPIKVGRRYKVGVDVVVQHEALRKKLESDNIIRGLTQGF